jgi:hypothetical protein
MNAKTNQFSESERTLFRELFGRIDEPNDEFAQLLAEKDSFANITGQEKDERRETFTAGDAENNEKALDQMMPVKRLKSERTGDRGRAKTPVPKKKRRTGKD